MAYWVKTLWWEGTQASLWIVYMHVSLNMKVFLVLECTKTGFKREWLIGSLWLLHSISVHVNESFNLVHSDTRLTYRLKRPMSRIRQLNTTSIFTLGVSPLSIFYLHFHKIGIAYWFQTFMFGYYLHWFSYLVQYYFLLPWQRLTHSIDYVVLSSILWVTQITQIMQSQQHMSAIPTRFAPKKIIKT